MVGISTRLVGRLLAGGCLVVACASPAAAQPPAALVSVAPVVLKENAESGHVFVATVNPLRRSVIGSAVDGRVVEFNVKAGDAVTAKQPLAQLLTAQMDIQIAAAQADLRLKQEELRELKNGARPEELREARARTGAAQALHDYSQARLQRTKSLFERNAVAEDVLQDDIAKALAAAQTLEAAKAAEDLVIAGPRAEKIAQAEARAAIAQEELNRLQDLLKKHTIVSPFDGFVVAEHTEIGQWIKSGELVAEVEDLAEVEIETQVLENYLDHVRVGAQARVEFPAIESASFVGEVTRIVPRADVRSRNFPVLVRMKNQFDAQGTPLVKSGMFARVWLPVQQREKVLLAPNDAVVMGGPTPVVYVVDRTSPGSVDAVARLVPVSLGSVFGSHVELLGGGPAAGQELVIEGNERLRPGQAVRIVAPSRDDATKAP